MTLKKMRKKSSIAAIICVINIANLSCGKDKPSISPEKKISKPESDLTTDPQNNGAKNQPSAKSSTTGNLNGSTVGDKIIPGGEKLLEKQNINPVEPKKIIIEKEEDSQSDSQKSYDGKKNNEIIKETPIPQNQNSLEKQNINPIEQKDKIEDGQKVNTPTLSEKINTIIPDDSSSNSSKLKIFPIVFNGKGKYGDFAYMIKQHEYKDALFIFNDNVEDHSSARTGGGNAEIRPYNKYGKHKDLPRSAGIPTGHLGQIGCGGFTELSDQNKKHIDSAIAEIVEILRLHKYDKIFYSCKNENSDLLGTSIFNVNENVIEYITQKIKDLPKMAAPKSEAQNDEEEEKKERDPASSAREKKEQEKLAQLEKEKETNEEKDRKVKEETARLQQLEKEKKENEENEKTDNTLQSGFIDAQLEIAIKDPNMTIVNDLLADYNEKIGITKEQYSKLIYKIYEAKKSNRMEGSKDKEVKDLLTLLKEITDENLKSQFLQIIENICNFADFDKLYSIVYLFKGYIHNNDDPRREEKSKNFINMIYNIARSKKANITISKKALNIFKIIGAAVNYMESIDSLNMIFNIVSDIAKDKKLETDQLEWISEMYTKENYSEGESDLHTDHEYLRILHELAPFIPYTDLFMPTYNHYSKKFDSILLTIYKNGDENKRKIILNKVKDFFNKDYHKNPLRQTYNHKDPLDNLCVYMLDKNFTIEEIQSVLSLGNNLTHSIANNTDRLRTEYIKTILTLVSSNEKVYLKKNFKRIIIMIKNISEYLKNYENDMCFAWQFKVVKQIWENEDMLLLVENILSRLHFTDHNNKTKYIFLKIIYDRYNTLDLDILKNIDTNFERILNILSHKTEEFSAFIDKSDTGKDILKKLDELSIQLLQ